jgi:hypothetical protein
MDSLFKISKILQIVLTLLHIMVANTTIVCLQTFLFILHWRISRLHDLPFSLGFCLGLAVNLDEVITLVRSAIDAKYCWRDIFWDSISSFFFVNKSWCEMPLGGHLFWDSNFVALHHNHNNDNSPKTEADHAT